MIYSSNTPVVLMFSVFFAPLCAQQLPAPEKLFPAYRPVETSPVSTNVTARIYVDATSSMRGFLGPGAAGFAEQLQKMEQVLQFGWRSTTVECYKFGVQATRVGGAACYAAAGRPAFYSLSGEQDRTRIENVLPAASGGSLAIIVTDLYEDEADLGTLFQAFKTYVFSKRLAVGIAGLRAGFNGSIFDIGLGGGTRPWRGERPFYALVIGAQPDVSRYFGELAKSGIPAGQLVILSSSLLKRRVSWDSTTHSQGQGLAEYKSLARVAKTDEDYGMLSIQQSTTPVGIDLLIDSEGIEFHPAVDWNRAANGLKVTVRRLRQNGETDQVDLGDLLTANLSAPAKVGDRPVLHLSWNPIPQRLLAGRFHAGEVRLTIGADATRMPAFIKQWSAPLPAGGTSGAFDGGKTQNLEDFVSGLWRSLLQSDQIDLGAIYVYFKR